MRYFQQTQLPEKELPDLIQRFLPEFDEETITDIYEGKNKNYQLAFDTLVQFTTDKKQNSNQNFKAFEEKPRENFKFDYDEIPQNEFKFMKNNKTDNRFEDKHKYQEYKDLNNRHISSKENLEKKQNPIDRNDWGHDDDERFDYDEPDKLIKIEAYSKTNPLDSPSKLENIKNLDFEKRFEYDFVDDEFFESFEPNDLMQLLFENYGNLEKDYNQQKESELGEYYEIPAIIKSPAYPPKNKKNIKEQKEIYKNKKDDKKGSNGMTYDEYYLNQEPLKFEKEIKTKKFENNSNETDDIFSILRNEILLAKNSEVLQELEDMHEEELKNDLLLVQNWLHKASNSNSINQTNSTEFFEIFPALKNERNKSPKKTEKEKKRNLKDCFYRPGILASGKGLKKWDNENDPRNLVNLKDERRYKDRGTTKTISWDDGDSFEIYLLPTKFRIGNHFEIFK